MNNARKWTTTVVRTRQKKQLTNGGGVTTNHYRSASDVFWLGGLAVQITREKKIQIDKRAAKTLNTMRGRNSLFICHTPPFLKLWRRVGKARGGLRMKDARGLNRAGLRPGACGFFQSTSGCVQQSFLTQRSWRKGHLEVAETRHARVD